MLILKARHEKVFFGKIYLSNIEHDVTTSRRQKKTFLSPCLVSVCLDIFLKTFFMQARPIPVQTKVHFKNFQFLAMTYDIGVLSCAFDVVKAVVCFSFVYAVSWN